MTENSENKVGSAIESEATAAALPAGSDATANQPNPQADKPRQEKKKPKKPDPVAEKPEPEEPEVTFTSGPCGRACEHREPPRGNLYGMNWLDGISGSTDYEIVEVQFKNTRKGYYRNPSHLELHIGDVVAVEAAPGHDIGQVVMVGKLVELHMRKANIKQDTELKRVFRLARPQDLEKFEEAKAREQDTMIRSRKIAEELGLNMKIGDVEYQGDGAKAIFYYIADERVDFRKLIRVLADTFKIRIEMKQIGARQEAGRIGGIGPCGRPLCCASWMTGFVSVGTSAARFQDLSMNPQKLAGQCAKLKCCLNFEVDTYMEASKALPPHDIPLETQDATYYHFKTDTIAGLMTYSTDKKMPVNCVTIPASRVAEIIAANKRGEKVESLNDKPEAKPEHKEFVELVGQDNINRFDKTKKKKKKKKPADQTQQPSQQPRQLPKGDKPQQPKQNKKGQQPQKPQGQQPQGQQKQPKPQGKPQKNGNQRPKDQNRRQKPKQPKADEPAK